MPRYVQVTDSLEAAVGGGILSALLSGLHSSFIEGIECDDTQTGDEVEFFVHMRAKGDPVILRCAVTEVRPSTPSEDARAEAIFNIDNLTED